MRSLALAVALLLGCRDKAPSSPSALAIDIAYPGARAEVIEAEVVEHVEQAVAGLRAIRAIESRIDPDRATVMLEIDGELDATLPTVQDALSAVQRELPSDLTPLVIRRTRRDDKPLLWLAVEGTLPVTQLSLGAQRRVVVPLQRVAGVAGVETRGFAKPVITVRPDIAKVAQLGLPVFEIIAAVHGIEVGQVDTLGDVVVKQLGDRRVYLRDLADIEAGFEREPGAPRPLIAIRAQVGANPKTVLGDVRAALAALELPPGLTIVETRPPTVDRPPAPLRVTLRGPSLDQLENLADAYVAALRSAGVTDVVRDPPVGEHEESVEPDRDRAAQLGVPRADIVTTLRAISGTQVGTIVVDAEPRPVVLKLPPPLHAMLDQVLVKTRQGQLLPLSSVVHARPDVARHILRRDRERAIELSIDAPSARLDAARKALARDVPIGFRAQVSP